MKHETGPASARRCVSPSPLKVAFFGHNRADSTIVKRLRAFTSHDVQVCALTFRRAGELRSSQPEWANIDLGVTSDQNYLSRIPRLIKAMVTGARRAELKDCDIFYARNLDMLLIAVLLKKVIRSPAPVVYECLDVREVMLGQKPKAKFFRWSERRLLSACRLLVVSSDDYITRYFAPQQWYRGQHFLLENKLSEGLHLSDDFPRPPPKQPWVIGLFGVQKCSRSLEILCAVADRLGDRVKIYLRGVPSSHISLKALHNVCARYPNVIYDGPYSNPEDLEALYSRVHFTWAADFLDPGGNSEWCLANRIYEGGLLRTVLIAAKGNATGRMIEKEGLGITLSEPLPASLASFLSGLSAESYEDLRGNLTAPRSRFIDQGDTLSLIGLLKQLKNTHSKLRVNQVAASTQQTPQGIGT